MDSGRTVGAAMAAALLAVPVLASCGGTPSADRQAAAFEDDSDDAWSLTVGEKAVVVFPEEDYGGWILWTQSIAETDVAVLVDCPADTSGFAFHDPRGGACVEAVGPGTATLVWTDPDGVDAYVSTIKVAD